MITVIGEVLFDVFPSYKVLGGAPFNVAVHLARFGFPVRFVSRVGNDSDGEKVRRAAHREGLDDAYIQTDAELPTGGVQVTLDTNGVPSFVIEENAAYDRIQLSGSGEVLLHNCRMLYIGSLVQRTPESFLCIQNFLSHVPSGCDILYDINLRHGCYSRSIIESTLARCSILKINDDELCRIADMFSLPPDADEAVEILRRRFDIPHVCVTCGDKGSVLFSDNGRFHADIYPVHNLRDTVGAGDAFAAVLAMGILRGWSENMILEKASRFASAVCECAGAIPDDLCIYKVL